MRGKLRDKRPTNKRDIFKRETLERRRPSKRDARTTFWLQGQEEDEFDLELEDEEEEEDEEQVQVPVPPKK